MSPDEKMSDEEKEALREALHKATLTDTDVQVFAEGVDESGAVVVPVSTGEDLLVAATQALDFVESLETPEPKVTVLEEEGAVAGFDALLRKLESLRSDITALQRGVVSVFAAQLLAFRGKVVELKSRISEEMVERLRMKFFKTFIESTFVDIIDNEFAALEKDLVDKIVEQTQERFKEFASRVRESEIDLRTKIVEQQDIVRSFMESLEEEAASQRQELIEKEGEIDKLEKEIKQLQSSVDAAKAVDAETTELARKVADLEQQIASLRTDVLLKSEALDIRTQELEKAKSETDEVRMELGEVRSELEVYKAEQAVAKPALDKSAAEVESLQEKVALLEAALDEKRKEADKYSAEIKEMELKTNEALTDRDSAEKEAKDRLKELESIQDRIAEVKNLEQKIYDLEHELEDTKKQIPILEQQREAFEKATKLVEKERDLALEARDLADERTKRYIQVLGHENNTKVLLLVDEVGSVTMKELGKSLGTPVGLVTKWARELEKIGVLKIEGDKAISTLPKIDVKEGEVSVD